MKIINENTCVFQNKILMISDNSVDRKVSLYVIKYVNVS